MDIIMYLDNVEAFSLELQAYIQRELAGSSGIQHQICDDLIYIGYKNLYLYLLGPDILSIDSIEEDYGVSVNLNIDINLYNNRYHEAVRDVAMISKWALDNYPGDFILLDDDSCELLIRRSGHIIADYTTSFPMELVVPS